MGLFSKILEKLGLRKDQEEEQPAKPEPEDDEERPPAPHHGVQSAASWWAGTTPKNRGHFIRWLIAQEPWPVDVQHSKAEVWKSLQT